MSNLPNLTFGVNRNAGVGPQKDREIKPYRQIDQAGHNELKFYWTCQLRVDVFGRAWIDCWP